MYEVKRDKDGKIRFIKDIWGDIIQIKTVDKFLHVKILDNYSETLCSVIVNAADLIEYVNQGKKLED